MAVGVGVQLEPSVIRAVVVQRNAFGRSRGARTEGGGSAGRRASRGAALEAAKRRQPSTSTPAASLEPGSPRPFSLVAVHELRCDTSDHDALTHALASVRRTLGIRSPIVLGLPNASAILATVKPLVASADRDELAVAFELQQQLPFGIDQSVWHYRWLTALHARGQSPPRDASGIRQARPRQAEWLIQPPRPAVVAAVRRSLLDERLACCRRAGLSIRAVTLSAVGTLNAWLGGPGADAWFPSAEAGDGVPVVLLDVINDQRASWILWTASSLQVVPIAGATAESLWTDVAASWDAIASERSPRAQQVWVVGSATDAARAREALQTSVRCDALELSAGHFAGTPAVPTEQASHALPALGLALQGAGLARVPLNLLANVQREACARRFGRLLALTSAVCAAAILGFGLSGMIELCRRRAAILQSLERQERVYQSLRPEARASLQRQQRMEQRSAELERLVAQAPALAQAIAQVVEALPDQVWLTKLEGAKDTAVDGLLEGRARSFQDVTQFLERLKGVAGMTTVKPLSTNVVVDQLSGKELIAFAVQTQRPLARPAAADLAAGDERRPPGGGQSTEGRALSTPVRGNRSPRTP